MRNYLSLSNMSAGFVAVMVGFTSSVVLVFQAATVAGANPAEISSWLFALGLSIGISCIGLSLYYRMPILIGWSTSGAALLATSLSGISMPEATGAFILAAVFTCLAGMTGMLEKLIKHIPRPLASAMIAGILLPFGMNIFGAMQSQFALVCIMLFTYLIGKWAFPRFVIIFVLMVGVCLAKMEGLIQLTSLNLDFTHPVFTLPVFSLAACINIAIPLFVVTMTSQNIPGIAILNNAGFKPPISHLMSWTGFANLLFAPLGCYAISLTALTAAICASDESDNDPAKRYKSTVFAGFCWLCIGLLGATIVTIFSAFPKELITAIAGIALIGTITSSIKGALEEDRHREAAIITILISASGISLFGIGAAFWGLFVGIFSSIVLNGFKKEEIAELVA